VRLLGEVLGRVLRHHEGDEIFERVEQVPVHVFPGIPPRAGMQLREHPHGATRGHLSVGDHPNQRPVVVGSDRAVLIGFGEGVVDQVDVAAVGGDRRRGVVAAVFGLAALSCSRPRQPSPYEVRVV